MSRRGNSSSDRRVSQMSPPPRGVAPGVSQVRVSPQPAKRTPGPPPEKPVSRSGKRPPPEIDRDKHWVEISRTYPIGWEIVHTLHDGSMEIYPHPWVPTKAWARWKARRMLAHEERRQASRKAPRERIDP